MFRRLKLFLVFATVLLLIAGCGLKKKISDSITEGLVEDALGDEADVDIDNGDISLTGEDGEEITFDEDNGLTIEGEDGAYMASGDVYEWPEGMAADYIPKFDGGKITYIYNADDSLILYIEETKIDDYKDYVNDVIDDGYTVDKYESSAEDMQLYTAKSDKGVTVSVAFINSEGYLQITVDASSVQE